MSAYSASHIDYDTYSHWTGRIGRALRDWSERQAVARQLRRLPDHLLCDIGIDPRHVARPSDQPALDLLCGDFTSPRHQEPSFIAR